MWFDVDAGKSNRMANLQKPYALTGVVMSEYPKALITWNS
jgi:hypothetical protein